ncbi:hypothetical protein [Sedimentimonas flavescens]|uniref:hypothetical protein n=1 Tax=Sedimentimonas flavescens TaxID=2851012 RepID=UPI001C4A729E|nr:hypothetical protein [Sedimentimonas flavescens]MBW0159490.1 hypothetical protein [Sedimentimonas flavescens]
MTEQAQGDGIGRTFTVASDEMIASLVHSARRNLVVAAPALDDAVVDALISRLPDRPQLSISIIIDSDPEVYRLGYGSDKALKRLHEVCLANDLALRKQPGLRVGVIVADDDCMIFAPTPLLIEAGSHSPEKPNALVLRGSAASQITAATSGEREGEALNQEVGLVAIRHHEIAQTLASLADNPPQPFDIARALRVFSSKVQYVEFEAVGYKLDRKVVPLPDELTDVSDTGLRDQITSRIRSPLKDLGKVGIQVERDGKMLDIQVDSRWLDAERKQIEDEFLYTITGFGKVILQTKRPEFEAAVEVFSDTIKKYIEAVRSEIGQTREDFVESVVFEYAPRWKVRVPKFYSDFQITPTDENIAEDLTRIAQDLFDKSIDFREPNIRIVPKNIAPESVRDTDFKKKVEAAFRKRRAPEALIKSLFEDFEAAPGVPDEKR